MTEVSVEALAEMAARVVELDKRYTRLESLEFASFSGGAGTWVEIETKTVAAPMVGDLIFSPIPQAFLHLCLIWSANARFPPFVSPKGSLWMRFNGDVSERYWWMYETTDHWSFQAPNTCSRGCTGAFPAKTTFLYAGGYPGWPFLAGPQFEDIFNAGHLWIPDYRNEYKKKAIVWDSTYIYMDSEELPWVAIIREMGGGHWHDTSPIASVTVRGAFNKNSKFSLYGIQGTFQQFP